MKNVIQEEIIKLLQRLHRELYSIIFSKDGKHWWTSNKGNKFCSFVQVQLRKSVLRSLYMVQLKGII